MRFTLAVAAAQPRHRRHPGHAREYRCPAMLASLAIVVAPHTYRTHKLAQIIDMPMPALVPSTMAQHPCPHPARSQRRCRRRCNNPAPNRVAPNGRFRQPPANGCAKSLHRFRRAASSIDLPVKSVDRPIGAWQRTVIRSQRFAATDRAQPRTDWDRHRQRAMMGHSATLRINH